MESERKRERRRRRQRSRRRRERERVRRDESVKRGREAVSVVSLPTVYTNEQAGGVANSTTLNTDIIECEERRRETEWNCKPEREREKERERERTGVEGGGEG